MADNKETEQTTGGNETAEQPAVPVKKKVAKKKAAKKKVTKKGVVSKKKVAKKQAKAAASQPTESAAPTATTSSSTAGEAPASKRSETIVTAQITKPQPGEVSAMPNESTGGGVFWVKVIFWLIILALVFMLIRSMAKHPGEQPSAGTTEASQEMAPLPAGAAPGTPEAGAGMEENNAMSGGAEDGVPTPSTGESPRDAAATAESPVSETPAGQQSPRDPHDESVAKILQEFDDLREAAQAEMEAMRNLIQAERDLHEAMRRSPPPPNYPGWRPPESNYGPYAPAPQYQNY